MAGAGVADGGISPAGAVAGLGVLGVGVGVGVGVDDGVTDCRAACTRKCCGRVLVEHRQDRAGIGFGEGGGGDGGAQPAHHDRRRQPVADDVANGDRHPPLTFQRT
jgi:hypothetical protein